MVVKCTESCDDQELDPFNTMVVARYWCARFSLYRQNSGEEEATTRDRPVDQKSWLPPRLARLGPIDIRNVHSCYGQALGGPYMRGSQARVEIDITSGTPD